MTGLTPGRIITWGSIPEKLPVTSPASVNWITFSVSDSANPVHHDGHVQGGYSVPLIITASDITSHQSVSRKISARHFAGIFQWLTGIRTENIPPFNPLTDEDNEPVMVFNGERNVPADSLKPQPLILPVKGK